MVLFFSVPPNAQHKRVLSTREILALDIPSGIFRVPKVYVCEVFKGLIFMTASGNQQNDQSHQAPSTTLEMFEKGVCLKARSSLCANR